MITQGLIITAVGMIGVFLFLIVLVYVTDTTSKIIAEHFPDKPAPAPAKKAVAAVKTAPAAAAPKAAANMDKIAAVIAIAQRELQLPTPTVSGDKVAAVIAIARHELGIPVK